MKKKHGDREHEIQPPIRSIKEHDYSTNGAYFVTICTHNMENVFGEINIVGAASPPPPASPRPPDQTRQSNKMNLNEYGIIVKKCWDDINNHFNDVATDYFIIMPNHIHGIITVGARSPCPPDKIHLPNESNEIDIGGRGNRARTTLGNIIAYFKYASTKQINAMRNIGIQKIWHRNYYDRIIRNDRELNEIREYIINNPMHWETDNEYNISYGRGLPARQTKPAHH